MNKEKEIKKHMPLIKLLPNALTLLALCSGLTAIKLAMSGYFERAVLFIVVAAILDVLDGRFARMLNAQSKLGANLDSLCDFINFGFCPVFIMYLWGFKDIKIFGWGAVLITTVCTAIRLARFNVQEDDRRMDNIKSRFFSGIPSPAGGLLILAPLTLTFDVANSPVVIDPKYLVFYTMAIALLMASTLPTLSTKKLKIKHSMVTPVMILIGFSIVFTFLYGWLSMLIICGAYLLSIPYAYIRYKNMLKVFIARKEEAKKENPL
jgi:CDP-diacylglycerol--serine O-phosphatidyltransferase